MVFELHNAQVLPENPKPIYSAAVAVVGWQSSLSRSLSCRVSDTGL